MSDPENVEADVYVWGKSQRAVLVSQDDDTEENAEWVALSMILEDGSELVPGQPARITLPEWKAVQAGLV